MAESANHPPRSIRRTLMGALGLALPPPIVGAAYMVGLAIHDLFSVTVLGDIELLSKAQANELGVMMHELFGTEIVEIGMAICGAAIVVGGALGLAAWGLIVLRARFWGRSSPRGLKLAGHALLVIAALQLAIELRTMARYPELFAATWYRGHTLKRTAQLFSTDHLGPNGCLALSLLLGAMYVAWPPNFSSGLRGFWSTLAGRLRESFGSRMGMTTTGAVIALLIVVGWSIRSPSLDRPHGATSKPNFLLLAVDSLRADRVSEKVAPRAFGLARRATRFERAYVSVPHTFPSWMTILTGRHAHHHGIQSMFPRFEDRAKRFDALPERLARAGYATAVVSDYAGDIFSHVDLGFEHSHVPFLNFKQLLFVRALESQTELLPYLLSRFGRTIFPSIREVRAAADPDMLADDSIRMLNTLTEADRPFFMTVFFSTTHFPYAAPYPHYEKFTRSTYEGPFKYGRQLGILAEGTYTEEDVGQIRGLYDGAVASVDAAIGRILDELSRSGFAKNTVVIITADHGESLDETFGEVKRGFSHGSHLFGDEQIHVPLVIYDPRGAEENKAKSKVDDIVRDVDIAPTVLELAGVEVPVDLDGRSLVPAMRGSGFPSSVRAYAETGVWFELAEVHASLRLPYPDFASIHEVDLEHDSEFVIQKSFAPLTLVAKHRMIRDERFKLVYMPTRQGVQYRLFDTERDPNELDDVAGQYPEVRARLEAELWSWMLRDPTMKQEDGFLVPRDPDAPALPPERGLFMRLGAMGQRSKSESASQ